MKHRPTYKELMMHRDAFSITPPPDMSVGVVRMLEASITQAWDRYDGDPLNAQQFWNHLVANGACDVPRETSPLSAHDRMLQFLAESDRIIAEQNLHTPESMTKQEWDAYVLEIARRAGDVPRETSEGQS